MKKFAKFFLFAMFVITFTLAFAACGNKLSVTYDYNNGTNKTKTVAVSENGTIKKEPSATYKGYTFLGWTEEKSAEDGGRYVSFPYTVTKNVTLVANWTPETAAEYTLTFETDGGTEYTPIKSAANGYLLIPEVPEKEGYRFGGWYTDDSFKNEFFFETARMPAHDLTVYAKWIKSVKITFDTDGGSAVKSITADGGSSITAPESPTKSGMYFDGWYLDGNPYTFNTMPYSDIVLTAKWRQPIGNVTLTLNINTEVDVDNKTLDITPLEEGKEVKLDTAQIMQFISQVNAKLDMDVFAFGGWYADAACKTPFKALPYGDSCVNAYAKWIRNAAYARVSVNANGDNDVFYLRKGEKLPAKYANVTTELKYCEVSGYYSTSGKKLGFQDAVTMDMELYPDVTTKHLRYAGVNVTEGVVGYMVVVGFEEDYVSDAKAQMAIDLRIPRYYNGYEVRGIYTGETTDGNFTAFAGYTNIISLEVPSSVQLIGKEAFNGCIGLVSADIGSVISFGDYAFENCTNLADVTIDTEKITSIGAKIFKGTAFESTLASNNGFVSLGEKILYAYTGTNGIKVTIPENFTTIAGEAFAGTNIVSILIEDSKITSIGAGAFMNCDSLGSIKLPAAITQIPEKMFYGCNNLNTVYVTAGTALTSISDYAFYNCPKLSSVTLSNVVMGLTSFTGLRTIGDYAFYGTAIKNLSILRGALQSIGEYAFANNGVFEYADMSYLSVLTKIGAHAFENCTGMKYAILPMYLTEISPYTFYNCTAMSECGMYTNCRFTKVGESAFENCNLKLLALATDYLVTVSRNAFKNNVNLTNAKLGNSTASQLKKVEEGAFDGCSSLGRIILYSGITAGKAVEFETGWISPSQTLNFYVQDGSPELDANSEYFVGGSMMSYKDIYQGELQSYSNFNFKNFDKNSPVLSLEENVLEVDISTLDIAHVDVLELIKQWGKYSITDDESSEEFCVLTIENIISGMFRWTLQDDGTYNFSTTNIRSFNITLFAVDEFGNQSESVTFTFRLTETE